MNLENVIGRLKRNEGFSSGIYEDTNGIPTIGYGFSMPYFDLTETEASLILDRKVASVTDRAFNSFEWLFKMPDSVQEVVIEMCYQMGIRGFSRFKKTIKHLKAREFQNASMEMLLSKWARSDSKIRAERLAIIVSHAK